jgi:ketosteroid isomerase-like protein
VAQADVEVLKELYAHWRRGDFHTRRFFDPDVVYARIGADTPGDQGEWRGLTEVAAALAEWRAPWEDLHNDAERFIDLADRVLVLDRLTARGARSTAIVDHGVAQLFTLRGGRIVRWEAYWDRAEAMRTAGVKE